MKFVFASFGRLQRQVFDERQFIKNREGFIYFLFEITIKKRASFVNTMYETFAFFSHYFTFRRSLTLLIVGAGLFFGCSGSGSGDPFLADIRSSDKAVFISVRAISDVVIFD